MSFWKDIFKKKKQEPEIDSEAKHMRVVIASFADSLKTNGARILFENLQKDNAFDITYYSGSLPAESMRISSKNLPEISDFCVRIFRKIPADVIILGHQEKDKICLNFAAYGEYGDLSEKNWRIFDCLYFPLSLFEEPQNIGDSELNLIIGALLLCKKNISAESCTRQNKMLKNLIKFFEKDNSGKDLPLYCMPYVLNLISSIYFEYAEENFDKKAFELIKFMLKKSLQYRNEFFEKIHVAPIYIHLGNLFLCAAQNLNINSLICYKKALKAYRLAQKYLSKEDYPYDFAQISYIIAQALFSQWRFTGNLDSLREAISVLRQVEKIYTEKMFPASWAKVQHELGYYLSLLGSYTGSVEVLQLSIENMKNTQKIFYAEKYPFIWLNVQADIGRVYYFMGKKYNDIEILKEAEKYLRSALVVCDEKNAENEQRRIDSDLSKTVELIYLLQKK